MFVASSVRAVLQWWTVVLAIVALSPAPLALPSGIAVAAIALTGAAILLRPFAVALHAERAHRPLGV